MARTEILLCEVAARRFGLPCSAIRELLPAVAITPLPGAPAFVDGVINVRGSLIPVYDLAARFGLPSRPIVHTDHLVVLSASERVLAVRTERVTDLVEVDVSPVDTPDRDPAAGALLGVGAVADELVLVPDPRKLGSEHDLAGLGGLVERALGGAR